jgi:hypothetical protein
MRRQKRRERKQKRGRRKSFQHPLRVRFWS